MVSSHMETQSWLELSLSFLCFFFNRRAVVAGGEHLGGAGGAARRLLSSRIDVTLMDINTLLYSIFNAKSKAKIILPTFPNLALPTDEMENVPKEK